MCSWAISLVGPDQPRLAISCAKEWEINFLSNKFKNFSHFRRRWGCSKWEKQRRVEIFADEDSINFSFIGNRSITRESGEDVRQLRLAVNGKWQSPTSESKWESIIFLSCYRFLQSHFDVVSLMNFSEQIPSRIALWLFDFDDIICV